MKSKLIQVFEWDSLIIGHSYSGVEFSQRHFDSLCKWQEKQDKPFFALGHKRIKFSQWVGVIQVGSLIIEVLDTTHKKLSQIDSTSTNNTITNGDIDRLCLYQ